MTGVQYCEWLEIAAYLRGVNDTARRRLRTRRAFNTLQGHRPLAGVGVLVVSGGDGALTGSVVAVSASDPLCLIPSPHEGSLRNDR